MLQNQQLLLELYISSGGKVGWLLSGRQVATGLSAWWCRLLPPQEISEAQGVYAGQKHVPTKLQHCWDQQTSLLHTSVSTGLPRSLAIGAILLLVFVSTGAFSVFLGRHPTSSSKDELCVPVWVEEAGLSWPCKGHQPQVLETSLSESAKTHSRLLLQFPLENSLPGVPAPS